MNEETRAKATGRNLPISTKQTIEICNFIRGRNVREAKQVLEKVMKKEKAIPFKRFNKDMGHRKGKIASGRYPIKASNEILKLINSVEINAQNKGLDTDSLYIKEIIPNKSSNTWHYGRMRRRKMKRTHLNIVLEEKEGKKKKEKKTEIVKKEEKPAKEEKKND